MPKITIIGGGSYTWGPLFIRDILVAPDLAGSTITLQDIATEPLELVFALGMKIIQDYGYPIRLTQTADLDDALTGADFVILTITTGGFEAMRHDLEIPERYGVYHTVGDTVGPGGLARALRNIPVVVDIARRMEAICPNAWLFNYTNPMTTLCRAVTRETNIQTIGLCHEYPNILRGLISLLDVNLDDIQVRAGGINHLVWIMDLKIHGEDGLPALSRLSHRILEARGQLPGINYEDTSSLVDRFMVKACLFQLFGAFPAAGDRHVAEFFPYFLTDAADRGQKYGLKRTLVEERYQWREEARSFIQEILTGQVDPRPFLACASGEAVHRMISAVTNQGQFTGMMNLPNTGQIENLPPGVVVETFGTLDSDGVHPIPAGNLPPGVHAVLNRHILNQEITVEAALSGNQSLALQALINDPMVHNLDSAERMLDELLAANKPYLPNFYP